MNLLGVPVQSTVVDTTTIDLCRHVCPRCGGCDICCANIYGCRDDIASDIDACNDDNGDDE